MSKQLRPNPSHKVEQSTGRSTGARGKGSAGRPLVQKQRPIGTLHGILTGAMCVLLVVAPVLRGLYFQPQQLVYIAAIGALGAGLAIALALDRYRDWLSGPAEWFALAVVAAYTLSALTVAVNPRAALQSVLVELMLFLALWQARRLSRFVPVRLALLGSVDAATLVVASVGILTAMGLLKFPGAVVGDRLFSSLQYPNSTAAFVGAGFFLNLSLTELPALPWVRRALHMVGALQTLAFIFTLSRGAWLMWPFIAIAYYLTLPRSWRGMAAIRGLAMLVPALAVTPFFSHGLASGNGGTVTAATLVCCALAAVFEGFTERVHSTRIPRRTLTAGLIAAGVVAVGVVLKLAPRLVFQRISAISPTAAYTRFALDIDALKVLARYPWLGTGGGGWLSLFERYESYGYYSTQVHNFILQTWVETGVPGVVAIVGLWVTFAVAMVRVVRAKEPVQSRTNRVLAAGVLWCGAFIGLHSIFDFDLSLVAVALVAWVLFGVADGMARPEAAAAAPRRGVAPPQWGPAAIATCVCLALSASATIFGIGWLRGNAADAASRAGHPAQAVPLYRAAIADDPLTGSYYMNLAQAELAGHQPTAAEVNASDSLFGRGIALDPFSSQYHQIYGQFLISRGLPEAAIQQFDLVLEDAPFMLASYEGAANGLTEAGEELLNKGQVVAATRVFEQVNAMPELIKSRSESQPGYSEARLRMPPTDVAVTVAAGECEVLLGQYDPGIRKLDPMMRDPQYLKVVAAWDIAANQVLHRESAVQSITAEAEKELSPSQIQTQVASVLRWIQEMKV